MRRKRLTGGVVSGFVWRHPGMAVLIFIALGVLDGVYGPFGLNTWL